MKQYHLICTRGKHDAFGLYLWAKNEGHAIRRARTMLEGTGYSPSFKKD